MLKMVEKLFGKIGLKGFSGGLIAGGVGTVIAMSVSKKIYDFVLDTAIAQVRKILPKQLGGAPASGGPDDDRGGPDDDRGGPFDDAGGGEFEGGPADDAGGYDEDRGGPADDAGGGEFEGGPADDAGGSEAGF